MFRRPEKPRILSKSDDAQPLSPGIDKGRHLAVRLDDAWLRFQTRLAIRRGRVETVIPYTGYGTTSWVRVLARVVRSDPRDAAGHANPLQESMRGWRNFVSAPVAHASVQVTIAGTVHDVEADRGGVVDVRIEAALDPGWHTITLQSGVPESLRLRWKSWRMTQTSVWSPILTTP
ncbi:hypothetical protein J2Y41_003360 [Arthrobacter sp. 1088]|nr:hypothetical protein [Arthrobacter sp. 1088]